MGNEILYFNGVNGGTGEYLLPPVTPQFISKIARGEVMPADLLRDLKTREFNRKNKVYKVKEGVNPKNLNETGWGVIFHHAADPRIQEALKELLDLRREQAGSYYRELAGEKGYRPGDSKIDFLRRFSVGFGGVDPKKLPYYLLIVGGPEEIPYTFQYHLDVQFAVGRIHFQTLREYAQYARSVVEAETRPLKLSRQAGFFGVQNEDDAATNLSAKELVEPLAQSVAKDQPGWTVNTYLETDATKSRLKNLVGGKETSALLFTASHGVGFDYNHPNQRRHQGALLCQDWPGPKKWRKEIPEKFYLSADDVSDNAELLGLMLFNFACYSAGTPKLDDFAHANFLDQREVIAPHAFLASLPQRLLAHPNGGALAVVGHVDRAWGYSFMWEGAGRQLQDFESVMKRLMEGHPIGSALEPFNERYSEVATSLTSELEEVKFRNKIPDDLLLAELWTTNNDARDYMIIGDPAAKLAVADDATGLDRSPIAPITLWSEGEAAHEVSDINVLPASEPGTNLSDSAYQAGGAALDHTIKNAMATVAEYIKSVATLSVQTEYVRIDGTENANFDQAQPAVLTIIRLDGDSRTVIPTRQSAAGQQLEIDTAMFEIHRQNVNTAIEYRARLVNALLEGLQLRGK